MIRFRLHPAARKEVRDAAEWYEERRPGLGFDFVKEVRRGVTQIVEAPDRWPRWSATRAERKVLLRRFPFWLVYEQIDGVTVIKAVAHAKRRSAYWRRRRTKKGSQEAP